MKRNLILLVDADADTCAVTLDAAKSVGLDVRFAQIERDLSELTEISLDDIAIIVLDYHPDVHGLAITDLLDHWQPARPVILVSSDEDLNHPLMFVGTRARHLSKPVTVARLVHAFRTLLEDDNVHASRCDRWGHPDNGRNGFATHKPEKLQREIL